MKRCDDLIGVTAGLLVLLAGCFQAKPQGDSKSNWLSVCGSDADCSAGFACLCGVCTTDCDGDDACSLGGQCLSVADSAFRNACALVDGEPDPISLCGITCDDSAPCPSGKHCQAGRCVSKAVGTVDLDGAGPVEVAGAGSVPEDTGSADPQPVESSWGKAPGAVTPTAFSNQQSDGFLDRLPTFPPAFDGSLFSVAGEPIDFYPWSWVDGDTGVWRGGRDVRPYRVACSIDVTDRYGEPTRFYVAVASGETVDQLSDPACMYVCGEYPSGGVSLAIYDYCKATPAQPCRIQSTVYGPDGQEVQRTADISIAPGRFDVRVDDLPTDWDGDLAVETWQVNETTEGCWGDVSYLGILASGG